MKFRVGLNISVVLLAFSACNSQQNAQHALSARGLKLSASDFGVSIRRGDPTIVEEFLEAGMPLNIADTLNSAVLSGNAQILKILLRAGVEPKDQAGFNPLASAVRGGQLEMSELLLSYGANPNLDSPLRIATESNFLAGDLKYKMVRLLINRGAHPDLAGPDGTTCLHVAASKGDLQLVEELVAGSANLDARDEQGRSALHYAATRSQFSVIRYLLHEGADPNLIDHAGRTPYGESGRAGDSVSASYLTSAMYDSVLDHLKHGYGKDQARWLVHCMVRAQHSGDPLALNNHLQILGMNPSGRSPASISSELCASASELPHLSDAQLLNFVPFLN